jgi:hypothetical protein
VCARCARCPGNALYALSQGTWDGAFPGSPALPDTGALVGANGDGTFTEILNGLDRPTSLGFIGKAAYVVTLPGEVWRIHGVSRRRCEVPMAGDGRHCSASPEVIATPSGKDAGGDDPGAQSWRGASEPPQSGRSGPD